MSTKSPPDYTAKTLTLKNGERVLVRKIEPSDGPLIEQGFEQLSKNTIRHRFMGLRKNFNRDELRFLTQIDGRDHFALGVSNLEETQGIAVARYIRDAKDSHLAELAIVIIDQFQRLGLGRQLIQEITYHAKLNGITHFKGQLAQDNDGMKSLIAQFNKSIHGDGSFLIEL